MATKWKMQQNLEGVLVVKQRKMKLKLDLPSSQSKKVGKQKSKYW